MILATEALALAQYFPPSATTNAAGLSAGVNSQFGASYTVANADCGKLVTLNNAISTSVTLPQAGASGNFVSGCSIKFENLGVGIATITPTISTVDDTSYVTLALNQGMEVQSNGANYFTVRGAGISVNANGFVQVPRVGGGDSFGFGSVFDPALHHNITIAGAGTFTKDGITAIGWSASATGHGCAVFGYNSSCTGDDGTALGGTGAVSGGGGVAVGTNAVAPGNSVAIKGSGTGGGDSVMIGQATSDGGFTQIIVIGKNVTPSDHFQAIIGGSALTDAYFGSTSFLANAHAKAFQWGARSEPTCNPTNRGYVVMVQGGAGVADTFRICSKDAADAYSYRDLF